MITDAASTDGTWELLQAWKNRSQLPIVLLRSKKCNIAKGRNLAIRTASYSLILSTDFGCRFHPQWIESMIAPFADASVQVVGGAFMVNKSEIYTLAAKAAYLLNDGYFCNVKAESFIPSSRSIAYYKQVFNQLGGYSEWLTLAADDYVFGKLIKKGGYKLVLIPKPFVYWGRHKEWQGYNRESFRYGLGDGEARVNTRNFISNFLEVACRYVLLTFLVIVVFLLSAGKANPFVIIICFPFIAGFRSYLKLFTGWWKCKSSKYNVSVLLFGVILLETTRINYLKGYIKGLLNVTPLQKEAARNLQVKLS